MNNENKSLYNTIIEQIEQKNKKENKLLKSTILLDLNNKKHKRLNKPSYRKDVITNTDIKRSNTAHKNAGINRLKPTSIKHNII